MTIRRAAHFVPGANEKMLSKSLDTEADSLILDLEDAAEIGIVSAGKVREIYSEFLDGDRSDFDSMPLTRMRGRVIGQLIDESWRIFENDYVQIMNGSRTADLKSDFDLKFRDAFDKIKIVYQEIFADPFKVSTDSKCYT